MRIAVLLLGLIGAAAAAFLGIKWLGDANEHKAILDSAASLGMDMSELDNLVKGAYTLIAGAVLGVIGAFTALKRAKIPAAALMIVGGAAPAIFEPKALVFSGLLIVAGVLALGIRRA